MSFYDALKTMLGFKASDARIVAAYSKLGQPITTPANYEAFAHKGYAYNTIVYTAVSKIAHASAAVDWVLYKKGRSGRSSWEEIEQHPLLELWARPNPMQSKNDFIESVVGFKKITGNSYIEAVRGSLNKPPVEMWPVRPDRMRIIPGSNGYPLKYEFKYQSFTKLWDVDQISMRSDILHMKSFNPTDDWYGLSPIQAILLTIDQYNAGQRWNLSLLQNEARPSGVLQMQVSKENPKGSMSETQYQMLKSEIESKSGPFNSGRPMILQGGLEWKQMSLSPKDMDFMQLKGVTANDIATAYGVPAEMLGLGQKTFANYKEARLAFYEETVLPTLDAVRDSVNHWLTPYYGDDLYLDYDPDSIDALVEKREQKYQSLQTTTFLTVNEKREAAGYSKIDGLDLLQFGPQFLHVDNLEQAFQETSFDEEEDEEELEDDEHELSQEQNDEELGEDDKAYVYFKSINLLNSSEKQRSWRQQNQLREKLTKPFERQLEKDFSDLTKRLSDAAEKLVGITDKKLLEYALVKETDSWATDVIEPTMKTHIEKAIKVFGETIFKEGKSLGYELETKKRSWFDDFVSRYVSRTTGTHIVTIKNTTQKRIKRMVSKYTQEAIDGGDTLPSLRDRIQDEFPKQTKSNAMRIARTEVAAASSAGSFEAVKSLEIPGMTKEWVSAIDSRSRGANDGDTTNHIAMNGERVGIDEKFSVPNAHGGDDLMDVPLDGSAPPEQIINCRCVAVFKREG
jgi:HK97 family phage portal protein